MTDNELAAELEFYKGNEDLISPDLISKASERIYALSANCSLLKASLAQAERESEAALSALTANAEPFGYFRCLPLSGWEDCAETDEGAIPLYERPQPDRVAEIGAELLNAVDTICSQSGEDTEKFARWMCDESGLLQMVMAHFGAADKDKKIAALEAEVERLRAALAASCEEEREQLYEAGPFAGGCARATEAESEVERLRALLSEAADEIQNWGAYASEYFQEKHDLAGCVAEFKAAAMAGKEAKS